MDGLEQFMTCAVELPECSGEAPCPFHDQWKQMRARLMEALENTTLTDMARAGIRKKQASKR